MNRKDRRKAERQAKKSQKSYRSSESGRPNSSSRRTHDVEEVSEADWSEDDDDDDDEIEVESPRKKTAKTSNATQAPAKGILKKAPPKEPSPPPTMSRAVKDRLAQDDAEIAALEKRLGIKGKKAILYYKRLTYIY